jgi:gliding-associated putative ABC transporter substrate-binding component GldG
MQIQKTTKKKADLAVTALVLAGIVIVLNFFSYQLFYRYDITENKDYSISKVSKRMVKDSDDLITVKVYFSSNLPSQFIALKQDVKDILNEYAQSSGGKFKVEFIDPGKDEKIASELQMLGIPQLQFEVYEKDKLQLVNGYLGLTVSYGGNTEAIPVVEQDAKNLEYQITTSIKKVAKKEIDSIGYVTSNGTAGLDGDLATAKKKLEELYTVQMVDLTGKSPVIPAGIKTLVIEGPKEKFSTEALKAIDKFVMQGGGLALFADGVVLGEGLTAKANDIGLEPLLSAYGIKLNKDLALDVRNNYASFSQGFMRFSLQYPYWPKVEKPDFDSANSTVSDLESVTFPWVSTIDIDESKLGTEAKVSRLAQTTSKGWLKSGDFDLNPQQTFSPSGAQGPKTLAVSVTGKLKSAFPDPKQAKETAAGKIVVVGDSDFAKENLNQLSKDNITFFQNVVDSITIDQDLISIRSKGVSSRPLKEISDSERTLLRYMNIFGITALVLVFGVSRYYMRRRRRYLEDL